MFPYEKRRAVRAVISLCALMAATIVWTAPSAEAADADRLHIGEIDKNLCLEAGRAGFDLARNGTKVLQRPCSTSVRQVFSRHGLQIQAANGLCLAVRRADYLSNSSGARVHLSECADGPNYDWTYDRGRLRVGESLLCLKVRSADYDNERDRGAITASRCTRRANQQWSATFLGPGPDCDPANAGFLPGSHCGDLARYRASSEHVFTSRRTGVMAAPPSTASGEHGRIGAFRVKCFFSHFDYVDPVGPAPHLHAFFGNTEVPEHATPASLRVSGDSTCMGGHLNRSAYWVPALMAGDGHPIAPEHVFVYYKTGYDFEGRDGLVHSVLPPIGTVETAQNHTNVWRCMDTADARVGDEIFVGRLRQREASPTIPACDAGNVLVMNVAFQQCWDGTAVADRPGENSTPLSRATGTPRNCAVHVVPKIEYLVYYVVPAGGSVGLRLASDGPAVAAGSTAHADWMNGWVSSTTDAPSGFLRHCVRGERSCAHQFRPGLDGTWQALGTDADRTLRSAGGLVH